MDITFDVTVLYYSKEKLINDLYICDHTISVLC